MHRGIVVVVALAVGAWWVSPDVLAQRRIPLREITCPWNDRARFSCEGVSEDDQRVVIDVFPDGDGRGYGRWEVRDHLFDIAQLAPERDVYVVQRAGQLRGLGAGAVLHGELDGPPDAYVLVRFAATGATRPGG